jgi:drug/metabolite transporter (DMT)-like permease
MKMNIKIRLALSLLFFCISAITVFITKESINPHHSFIMQSIIISTALFFAVLSITSLFNVKNKKHKKIYFVIVGIIMIYPIFSQNYIMYSTITKTLYSAIVVSGTVAFVLRFFSLIRERYDSLPD